MTKNSSLKHIYKKTNIESIDRQYQSIENLRNELYQIKKGNCELNEVSQIFYKLIYIKTHYFMQEQITLAKYKYNRLSVIKAIHKVFIDKVMADREGIKPNSKKFCIKMLNFVDDWFVDYIEINNDAIKFLISKNVK